MNDVMNYKPSEKDYRFWLVVNPSTWMMPILFAVLLTVLAIHAAILSIAPTALLFVDEAPVAAAPAAQ